MHYFKERIYKIENMKIGLLILVLIVFGCETKDKKNIESKTQIENKKFYVGDVNNDKKSDTAFISLKRNIKTDEIECGEKNCHVKIKFSKIIPEISIDQSLGVFIKKTKDLNNDKANEIIMFSRTYQGWWNDISVWSFHNGKWNEIGKTMGFILENEDFENRIINENDKYYLIGEDMWNEDENGAFKKIKVKI
jgi:hypothetical protein